MITWIEVLMMGSLYNLIYVTCWEVMGMVLTGKWDFPAAIGIMLGLDGLGGRGSTCRVLRTNDYLMMSIEDNDIGDVIAIGIGTSMLQFKNIRRPVIWLLHNFNNDYYSTYFNGLTSYSLQCNWLRNGNSRTCRLIGCDSSNGKSVLDTTYFDRCDCSSNFNI